jgi:hypothetical protein
VKKLKEKPLTANTARYNDGERAVVVVGGASRKGTMHRSKVALTGAWLSRSCMLLICNLF